MIFLYFNIGILFIVFLYILVWLKLCFVFFKNEGRIRERLIDLWLFCKNWIEEGRKMDVREIIRMS